MGRNEAGREMERIWSPLLTSVKSKSNEFRWIVKNGYPIELAPMAGQCPLLSNSWWTRVTPILLSLVPTCWAIANAEELKKPAHTKRKKTPQFQFCVFFLHFSLSNIKPLSFGISSPIQVNLFCFPSSSVPWNSWFMYWVLKSFFFFLALFWCPFLLLDTGLSL